MYTCVWDRVRRQDQTEILLLLYPLIVILPLLPLPLCRVPYVSLSFSHSSHLAAVPFFSLGLVQVVPMRYYIVVSHFCSQMVLFVSRLSLSLAAMQTVSRRFPSVSNFFSASILSCSPALSTFFSVIADNFISIKPRVLPHTEICNCFQFR